MSETYIFSWRCGNPGRRTSTAGSTPQQHQTARKELRPADRPTRTSETHDIYIIIFPENLSHCTWSERGTVGHSCDHRRQIPVTPKVMNITPKNRRICVEKKTNTTFNNLSSLNRGCMFRNVHNTLCSQCKLSGSSKATWKSAKSCNE